MICCKLTYHRPNITISEKVNRVHKLLFFFLDQKTIRVLLSKMQKNVGATEWIKDENENHFKNGNKGQKRFNKNVEKFCWEKTKRN